MRRPRPAPSAARTASSLRRAEVRAKSKPATLAQATRSKRPTAPSRVRRAVRTSPTMASARGTTAASLRSTSFPYCALMRRAIALRFGARLGDGNPIAEAAEASPIMRGAAGNFRIEFARNPGGDAGREIKPLGHHADHGVDCSLHPQVEFGEIGLSREISLPIAIADDRPRARRGGAALPGQTRGRERARRRGL